MSYKSGEGQQQEIILTKPWLDSIKRCLGGPHTPCNNDRRCVNTDTNCRQKKKRIVC